MAGYIANVWGVACPTCQAPADRACRDLRGNNRALFGRRTHRTRAQELRKQKLDARTARPRTQFVPINIAGAVTQIRFLNEGMINLASSITTTANSLQVYQDLTWNGWVVGNNTTGTSTYITDEQLQRFNGTGITWDWVNPTYVSVTQEQVYQRWQVLQDREVPTPEELQRREDEAQARRERETRLALERQQREEQLIEERLMAHARGLELLDMILTPEQREQRHTGRIQVTGSEGGRFVVDIGYRSVHGNVYEEDAHGCILGRVCIAPQMRVAGRALPLSDGWVGQIMAIQTDEAEFRRIGNWSGRRECQHPDVPILERAA